MGFAWPHTLLRRILAIQLNEHKGASSRTALCPWPLCAILPPGPVHEAGLMLLEGPLSLPWGKATPRCSQGHGGPGTASTPPWHPLRATGTCGKGRPAAAFLTGTPGDGLMCVLR